MFINQEDEKKFKEFFDSCIKERLNKLSDEYGNSTEYLNFSEQISDSFNDLKNVLPEGSHHLLHKHEDLYTDMLIYYQKHYFKQGLSDCFIFMKYLFNIKT
jgi:hypothetical protein